MRKLLLFTLFALSSVLIITLIFTKEERVLPQGCLKLDDPYQRLECLKPYFEKLTYKYSAPIALNQAQKLKKERVIDDCHLAAHFIGEANFIKHNSDTGKAFASCSLGCIEGCYHGVMEAYIHSTQSLEEALTQAPILCKSIAQDPLLNRQCIHGVGHGILRHEVVDLIQAIDLCKKFPDQFSAKTCLEGVFMENMNENLFFDKPTLITKIPTTCEKIYPLKDEGLISMCIESIGEGLMFYTGHDLEKSKKLCGYLPFQYQDLCVSEAIKEAETNLSNL